MKSGGIKVEKIRSFSKVCFEGLEAYADTYAMEGCVLKLLSLFGSRVSVRAVWSALFSGASVELDGKQTIINIDDSWKVSQKILPSGVLQAVCFCKLLDLNRVQNEFLVLGETKEDVSERVYLYFDRVAETPISREWCGWILERALLAQKASWLESLNLSALIYRHDEQWLENLITESLSVRKKVAV